MTLPGLPHRWSDEDWRRFLRMIRHFGYTEFEFWLTPRLFSREGLDSDWGRQFARQIQVVIDYAGEIGLSAKMLCILTTVGEHWHTHCPNLAPEWSEVRFLWHEWTRRLRGLGVVCIFPGDPGGCSRNGCTAETYVDRSLEICEIVRQHHPSATIELGTWGNPIWGWGNIQGPPDWDGRFFQEMQPTAWRFDRRRADRAMEHLLKRLGDFPERTRVAINMGFNSDGDPDADDGRQDARPWAREIAKTHPIVTWDMSLCEGENAIVPHCRVKRLFAQRRREREAAPYIGGICFTMTPLLNPLSLYLGAQSFVQPDADGRDLARSFFRRLFGPQAEVLADLMEYFEVIPDWGNYEGQLASAEELGNRFSQMVEVLEGLNGASADAAVGECFHPHPEHYRTELLFFAKLFAQLSAGRIDPEAAEREYWNHVYAIYDRLPQHVDPRPRAATRQIVRWFQKHAQPAALVPGKWS